jgi:hypothetical protein
MNHGEAKAPSLGIGGISKLLQGKDSVHAFDRREVMELTIERKGATPSSLRWTVEVLEIEMRQLLREQEHLQAKSGERDLTQWENIRIEELTEEMALLVSELASL